MNASGPTLSRLLATGESRLFGTLLAPEPSRAPCGLGFSSDSCAQHLQVHSWAPLTFVWGPPSLPSASPPSSLPIPCSFHWSTFSSFPSYIQKCFQMLHFRRGPVSSRKSSLGALAGPTPTATVWWGSAEGWGFSSGQGQFPQGASSTLLKSLRLGEGHWLQNIKTKILKNSKFLLKYLLNVTPCQLHPLLNLAF